MSKKAMKYRNETVIHRRMMAGESIPAYRPVLSVFDGASLIIELADALHRLRAVVPHFWNDESPEIGELDKALEQADNALADPGITRVRELQRSLPL